MSQLPWLKTQRVVTLDDTDEDDDDDTDDDDDDVTGDGDERNELSLKSKWRKKGFEFGLRLIDRVRLDS